MPFSSADCERVFSQMHSL